MDVTEIDVPGFSVDYTAIALSSEDGQRQVVICANGDPSTPSTSKPSGTLPAGSRGSGVAGEPIFSR